jgi:hypothetical protein
LKANTYAFSVALSAILIWDLGVPSFILAVLFKKESWHSVDEVSLWLLALRRSTSTGSSSYCKIFIIRLAVFVGRSLCPSQYLTV